MVFVFSLDCCGYLKSYRLSNNSRYSIWIVSLVVVGDFLLLWVIWTQSKLKLHDGKVKKV